MRGRGGGSSPVAPFFLSHLVLYFFTVQGPAHCLQCKNHFIKTLLNDAPFNRTCVDTCPVGTYLEANMLECVPCPEHCSREDGCAGPLPYLDLESGCLDCFLVQLNQIGEQARMLANSSSDVPLIVDISQHEAQNR